MNENKKLGLIGAIFLIVSSLAGSGVIALPQQSGFDFILANRGGTPIFDAGGWYRPWKRRAIEFKTLKTIR